MTTRATGPCDVKIAPLDPAFKTEDNSLGRMSIDKQDHGDLGVTGKGEMLTDGTAIKGSGVYVAVERVAGTLHGRSGTFLLQHSGVMTRGTPHLSITVVADSGSGTGITDGKHSYAARRSGRDDRLPEGEILENGRDYFAAGRE